MSAPDEPRTDETMSDVSPADAQNTHQGRPTGIERGAPPAPKRDEAEADRSLSRKASVPKGGVGYES
jgi:hypothetical protein